MTDKYYITGIRGFLGGQIANRLDMIGESVYGCDKKRSDGNDPFDTLSILSLSEIPRLDRYHTTIHCAALCGVDRVTKDPIYTFEANVVGFNNVILNWHFNSNLFGSKHGSNIDADSPIPRDKRKFIFFSSSEVFGNMTPGDEYSHLGEEVEFKHKLTAADARGIYGLTKICNEYVAAIYYNQFKSHIIGIRPFNVYGPGQTGDSAMMKFITAAISGDPIKIYGDGKRVRSWCFIEDFIDGAMKAIEFGKPGSIYNIGDASCVANITELAELVKKTLNSKSKIVYVNDISNDIDVRYPALSKTKKDLKWQAKMNLSRGIEITAQWVKRHKLCQK